MESIYLKHQAKFYASQRLSLLINRTSKILLPEEYLGQGQRCLCLCELVCEHAHFYRVVIQEGLWQDQTQIPRIE